jgi:Tfp pilus assembly protein PilE
MIGRQEQSGFTAVELLITLFVAAAFLIAGYQLFNVVIKDGGQARAESTAGNVAYDYLRRYAPEATNPCTAGTVLNNADVTVDGLSNAKITVAISCPPGYGTTGLSKVEATITYNTPQQTAKYSTFTNGVIGNDPLDITNGLVGWWKLNGNTDDSIGIDDGTGSNISPTTSQNGLPNGAYVFNGSSSEITIPDSTSTSPTAAVTVSAWARPASIPASTKGIVSKDISGTIANPPYALQLIAAGFNWTIDNAANTTITVSCSNVTPTAGTWYHLTGTFDGSLMRIYVNGTQCTNTASQTDIGDTTGLLRIGQQKTGQNRWFDGTIDDVRIYNRALPLSEIQTIYTGGAR